MPPQALNLGGSSPEVLDDFMILKRYPFARNPIINPETNEPNANVRSSVNKEMILNILVKTKMIPKIKNFFQSEKGYLRESFII
ncbi:hypothetical protein [Methanobacterium congolense]|uniref:hypothetical protein n=1 Tax=Methanobacterium congolense TaxID=118062 RepID=UPI001E2EE22E|nr:hypothetical protein [Methanobacterium congolense]